MILQFPRAFPPSSRVSGRLLVFPCRRLFTGSLILFLASLFLVDAHAASRTLPMPAFGMQPEHGADGKVSERSLVVIRFYIQKHQLKAEMLEHELELREREMTLRDREIQLKDQEIESKEREIARLREKIRKLESQQVDGELNDE